MSTPEPVDEQPLAVPVEVRGGDRDADFMKAPPYAKGGLVTAALGDELPFDGEDA